MDDREEKREAYATVALHALLSSPDLGVGEGPEWFAGFAVRCADALLAELAKPPAPAKPKEGK
jgi:hypothetical protein